MSTTTYDHLLRPGESASMQPPEHGSQDWAYGSNFAAISNNTHERGNSVVIDIEPGGATEPVLIESDIVLSITVLKGRGRVVLWNSEIGGEVTEIKITEASEPLVLFMGDAYYYLNDGPENLILRDDSTPAFEDGDETLITAEPQAGRVNGREVRLPIKFWLGY